VEAQEGIKNSCHSFLLLSEITFEFFEGLGNIYSGIAIVTVWATWGRGLWKSPLPGTKNYFAVPEEMIRLQEVFSFMLS